MTLRSGKIRKIVKVKDSDDTLGESQIIPLARTSASQALKQLLEENNTLVLKDKRCCKEKKVLDEILI